MYIENKHVMSEQAPTEREEVGGGEKGGLGCLTLRLERAPVKHEVDDFRAGSEPLSCRNATRERWRRVAENGVFTTETQRTQRTATENSIFYS